MKSLAAGDLRAKSEESKKHGASCGKDFTLERIRRFQEADQKLQEACARLGIDKPHMIA
ncbi:hypothetical protein PKB_5005 [Pseudomonas knackmussii B13]|uniref:Uncharacterized protein n=1 Tax=Pseudomonas knackmussii (strain DSM 6978 / CCUG 54928 / LMG 23759 / B13) TaxID=1301098 RepID=A0A024HPG8_PSEKB|nr:hypothetical protein [Pseudomonas knackmussii]CDF86318.1 hypothetical protein PKB_5005 [Pseudomonas knackmussii B13]